MKKKIKKRPYPKMKSEMVFKKPGLYYFGGALHYIGKDGRIKHSNEMKVPKSEIMTLTEFNRRFYNPIIMKKMKDG